MEISVPIMYLCSPTKDTMTKRPRNQSREKLWPTKTGKKRKGCANITAERLALRNAFWRTLKHKLRAHIQSTPRGEQDRMARTIGICSADIHTFICSGCEHDREPTFSVGMAIMFYLAAFQAKASAHPAPSHTPHTRPDVSDDVLDAILATHYNPFQQVPTSTRTQIDSTNLVFSL